MRNIQEKDETCNQCHAPFDHVETMLGKVEGATEYQIKGERRKVAAFTSMSFENASWIAYTIILQALKAGRDHSAKEAT